MLGRAHDRITCQPQQAWCKKTVAQPRRKKHATTFSKLPAPTSMCTTLQAVISLTQGAKTAHSSRVLDPLAQQAPRSPPASPPHRITPCGGSRTSSTCSTYPGPEPAHLRQVLQWCASGGLGRAQVRHQDQSMVMSSLSTCHATGTAHTHNHTMEHSRCTILLLDETIAWMVCPATCCVDDSCISDCNLGVPPGFLPAP